MSLHLPVRRVLAAASPLRNAAAQTHQQRRGFKVGDFVPRWASQQVTKEVSKAGAKAAQRARQQAEESDAAVLQRNLAVPQLGKQSIFDEKADVAATADELADAMAARAGGKDGKNGKDSATAPPPAPIKRSALALASYEAMARSTDPDPRSRVRWTRRMVVRQVARALDPFGRETKAERLARTERTLTYRGPLWSLSIKKHVKLAQQVAGRTVDDALVQMRFSKKKFGRDVGATLDAARDEAAVVAGMGIKDRSGVKVKGEKIQLKDGSWITITDPSQLYIQQAWVNKGPKIFSGVIYPARRGHRPLWAQTTNLNLVLKEQKTLVREYKERKAKEDSRKPWVHLPNRPVTAQRQHYSW